MSATGIVFLALSVVMLGLGFYGASGDVVSATGLAESIGQMKNFYFLLGGLILFIVLYRLAFSKASLRVQHTMSTTIRYVILIGVGVFMVYPLLWMISATFKDNNEIFSTLSLIPTRAEKPHALDLEIEDVGDEQRENQLQRYGHKRIGEGHLQRLDVLRLGKCVDVILETDDILHAPKQIVIREAVHQRGYERIELKDAEANQPRQDQDEAHVALLQLCLLYTSPSPRDTR